MESVSLYLQQRSIKRRRCCHVAIISLGCLLALWIVMIANRAKFSDELIVATKDDAGATKLESNEKASSSDCHSSISSLFCMSEAIRLSLHGYLSPQQNETERVSDGAMEGSNIRQKSDNDADRVNDFTTQNEVVEAPSMFVADEGHGRDLRFISREGPYRRRRRGFLGPTGTRTPTTTPAPVTRPTDPVATPAPVAPGGPTVAPASSPGEPTLAPATTVAPGGPTSAPATTTSGPAGPTSAPATTTSGPAGPTSAPASTTSGPAGPTSAPASTTSGPAGPTSAPASTTSGPAGPTSAPASTTSGPAGPTRAPSTSTTPAPAGFTAKTPSTSVSAPIAPTPAPVATTTGPAASDPTSAPAAETSTTKNIFAHD